MATEKNKEETKTSTTKNVKTSLDAAGFKKSVHDALQEYMQALKDAYDTGQKKSEDLYQEYLKAQNEQQILAYESLKEDYRECIGKMQEAWGQDNAQIQVEEANRNYYNAINERQFEIRKNAEETHKNYVETLQKYNNQIQEQYINAYQDYLKAFQSTWQKVDVKILDANTLASIGQILITASNCAGNTIVSK